MLELMAMGPFGDNTMDINFIMAYEAGELDEEAIIAGFQKGIDDGTVWQLQGCYGRMARALIEGGHCTARLSHIAKKGGN